MQRGGISAGTTAEHGVMNAVRAALSNEARLGSHTFALAIENGDLTIESEVQDVAAKKVALEVAAAIPGVHHIVDRIRVRPARAMTDPEIRDHLSTALLAEPSLQEIGLSCSDARGTRTVHRADGAHGDITFEVSDGVVTLSGHVPSLSHKRLAGVIAWWVPGARDVVNGTEVLPPEADNDDEIADAVRIALEKDPLVDASGITAAVRRAVVTLSGSVASRPQREMAEADAWYVFGVDRVLNRLDVRTSA